MRPDYPVAVSREDCVSQPFAAPLGALAAMEGEERLQCPIGPLGRAVTIATDHPATADLLRRMWNAHAAPRSASPDIAIRNVPPMRGRFVDADACTQLLSWPYAPFTIVKQALRWQFAVACTGSSWLPLHGSILDLGARRVCITGPGGAGKSHLTRLWLESVADAAMLVDDWALLDSASLRIHPVAEERLHAKGAAMTEVPDGAELVELCDGSRTSPHTRYVIDRRAFPRFGACAPGVAIDAIVILEGAFGAPYRMRTSPADAREALHRDDGLFWDVSNRFLPPATVESMARKWESIVDAIPVFTAAGYADAAAQTLIDDVCAALERSTTDRRPL